MAASSVPPRSTQLAMIRCELKMPVGAIHAPAMKILLRLAKLPTDKSGELVVTCEHGPRAQLASSILNLIGYRHVTLLEGHMAAWRRERLPVET